MELKEFNLRVMLRLSQFNPKLRHLSTTVNGQHPLLVKALLFEIRTDIQDIGLADTIEHWKHFAGIEDNPAALGVQINIFTGKSDKGQQLRLDRLCKLSPDAPQSKIKVIEGSD